MDIFEIVVYYESKMFELGTCDVDHVSLITLLHTMSGHEEVPKYEYCVWVLLPWCSEREEVTSDSDLIDVFTLFSNHKEKKISFEIEKKAYIPLAPTASSNILNPHPRFMIHNQDLGFSDFENNLFNYEGDNEDANSVSGDSEEVTEVDSVRPHGGLDEDDLGLYGDSNEVSEVDRGMTMAG
ncbi:hypothetical protein Ddye_007021 [Dipteronia dyeriana]|uniref:Uncharacterized protein n=1 Tax=Dipteronia dyeriana TaxID=168575 RepID=A0AAD9XK65_9ROSI|nr:hypothetical protein Ddye_007021 [Dipteronia dyeriana]